MSRTEVAFGPMAAAISEIVLLFVAAPTEHSFPRQ
jgi:hypothetical protein